MPEPNETTISPQHRPEICSIRIVFPVESDDQAIEYKKKISSMFSSIPDALINFSIMSGRPPQNTIQNGPN